MQFTASRDHALPMTHAFSAMPTMASVANVIFNDGHIAMVFFSMLRSPELVNLMGVSRQAYHSVNPESSQGVL